MSNEHTPGPWRTSPANKGSGDRDMFVMADKPEGQAELAKVYDWAEYGGSLPAEANAKLIAAAPEMLAALEAVEALINERPAVVGAPSLEGRAAARSVFDRARAAINKATGG